MQLHWIRFLEGGKEQFGTLEGERVRVWHGDLFEYPQRGDRTLALAEVRLLTPVRPTKVIALWNNFKALGEKLGLAVPAEPLYLVKTPNSYLEPGGTIRHPGGSAKVVFEGELGIVIGKTCKQVAERDALAHVLGYTCANDVTVADILNRDASFAQWVRAKGFDTFCPFGPAVATGLDPEKLRVRTLLDGQVRQDYPVSDMRFSVAQLVSLISQDMSLLPGDIILCGTSIGVGSMKPGSTVEVEIDGIGRLTNRFN
ncbi:fumarylacetoacetate hydrolase family protein [Ramlibacter ginsenosidimutans]|uniref:Fumarylacetoacetate hydrolase family protein n=1 Tax=Ramlibacter ginsenosidimutans TaxID=502333 RepID=A0A934WQ84_9BURK|nr:fumarylacetoacetate hydrolase family protein [Ramlibacter ginsenosidimutans]MBK6009288.1 fumarylacetoacetate hydrolase family protein [Ramlibacter ginsenosidimutans]